MGASAVFPAARERAGLYESFYLRAFSPVQPLAIWIRYTVHKHPRHAPVGSVWCTLFDARRERPFQHKHTSSRLHAPAGGWIAVDGSTFARDRAEGSCGPASWDLRIAASEPELLHLRPRWLYRAPLPRTKLTTPAPMARARGSFAIAGEEPIELGGWPAMIGHNWGAEHAERWIWLYGAGFGEDPGAWLDVSLGRVRIGGRTTPWVANGTLSLGGVRRTLGGLAARGLEVAEGAGGCDLVVPGARGLRVRVAARCQPAVTAGWRYSDPGGGEHDVLNCSLASLALDVGVRDGGRSRLFTSHGAAYELGIRERGHGVPIAPFPDP